MPSAIDCNLFLFADDSAILVSHKEKSEVERLLSVELLNLSSWLTDNGQGSCHLLRLYIRQQTIRGIYGPKSHLKGEPKD